MNCAGCWNCCPPDLPPAQPLPEIFPAVGKRRGRVALLAGCVQQVLAPQINWATLRVLAQNGIETVIPRGQGCCGSLSLHIGEGEQARALARANLAVFPGDVDAIITNAAGCGSGMHEYCAAVCRRSRLPTQAEQFGNKVKDITVFLDELGFVAPRRLAWADPRGLS